MESIYEETTDNVENDDKNILDNIHDKSIIDTSKEDTDHKYSQKDVQVDYKLTIQKLKRLKEVFKATHEMLVDVSLWLSPKKLSYIQFNEIYTEMISFK